MINQENIIKEIIEKYNLAGYSGLALIYNGSPESIATLWLSIKTQKKVICFSVLIDSFVKQICPNVIDHTNSDQYELYKDIIKTTNEKNLMIINSYEYLTLNLIKPWKRFLNIGDYYIFKDIKINEIVDFNKINNLPSYEYKNYYTDLTISEDDLLWADETNKRFNGILQSEQDPSKHPSWFSFTMPQKQIISKLHQHLKARSHNG